MNPNNSIVQTSRKRKMVPDLYTILYFMLIFSEKTFSIAHNTLKDAIQDLRGNLFRAQIYRVKSKKKSQSMDLINHLQVFRSCVVYATWTP